MLYVGSEGQQDQLERALRDLSQDAPDTRRISPGEALARVPVLRASGLCGAIIEEDAQDIDVHALHQGYLRGLRRNQGEVHTDSEVAAERLGDLPGNRGGRWPRRSRSVIINAAGAWADSSRELAAPGHRAGADAARGLHLRRPERRGLHRWPAVVSLDETFYIKPDAGMLLGSPANADPVEPHDVQPEELDIAMGIYRIEEATTLTIRRPARTWAGLRSFVRDGEFVLGWDDAGDRFFWLAAQGGYGIQTAAAAAELAAALLRGEPPARLARYGMDSAVLAPSRLR